MPTDIPGFGGFRHRAGRLPVFAALTVVWLTWAVLVVGAWSPGGVREAICAEAPTPALELLE